MIVALPRLARRKRAAEKWPDPEAVEPPRRDLRSRDHLTRFLGWRNGGPRSIIGCHQVEDVSLGREVYDDFCVSCHGCDMVAPGGVTFDLRKFPKDDFERFRNAVLNGKPPAMPAWRDKISDDDVKLLWAYVRSGG